MPPALLGHCGGPRAAAGTGFPRRRQGEAVGREVPRRGPGGREGLAVGERPGRGAPREARLDPGTRLAQPSHRAGGRWSGLGSPAERAAVPRVSAVSPRCLCNPAAEARRK